jgi:hypothetical protein
LKQRPRFRAGCCKSARPSPTSILVPLFVRQIARRINFQNPRQRIARAANVVQFQIRAQALIKRLRAKRLGRQPENP